MMSIASVLVIVLGVWLFLLSGYNLLPDVMPHRPEIVDYLLGSGAGGLPDLFYLNMAEKRHLLDVRRLFATLEQVFWMLLSFTLLLWLTRQYLKIDGSVGLRVGYTGLVLVSASILPGLPGGFVPLFVLLHEVLFPPGSWIFPDDSILIIMFPLKFFFHFALWYVGILFSIFFILVAQGYRTRLQ